MRANPLHLTLLVAALTLATTGTAFAKCDLVANANDLELARDAIDAACSCASAVKNSDYVKCAKPVVAARVTGGMLDKTCKGEALKYAKKSTCGRPGSVVCCGVKTTGKTAHKIAKTAAKCMNTATLTACVSAFTHIQRGCSDTGCVSPVCGNDEIEPGESCEPPNPGVCDANCHVVVCDPPVTMCGNGTIDAGEACEPPGAGACTWDCQAAPCAATAPGEIDVACIAGDATVGAAGRAADYLLAWTGPAYRPDADVIGRRFDADGAPLDTAAHVVSGGVPCGGAEYSPAVGANAGGYVLAWQGVGPIVGAPPGPYYSAVYERPYDNSAALGTLDELAHAVPFGQCQTSIGGPTAVAPMPIAGAATFGALWQDLGFCLGFVFQDPVGVLLDFTGPPTKTDMTIGYELAGPPHNASKSPASIASLGPDTLAAWTARLENSSPPYISNEFVSGAWIAADGSSTSFSISTAQPGIVGVRTSVAAAADRFLVAWDQGPVDPATEIRGMRVTHLGGPLDVAGGILLASTLTGEVVGGPAAAFDGTVWLVAWTEANGGSNDLRAVAVQTDGTVVDATPRLLATGVSPAVAVASAGDGRSLVLYVRPDSGNSAVRAQLVPGM